MNECPLFCQSTDNVVSVEFETTIPSATSIMSTDVWWIRQPMSLHPLAGPNGTREIVKLFKLPAWKRPYSIQITSLAVGGLADLALFYPKLIFMDASFKRTRETRQADFVYRSVGAQGGVAATGGTELPKQLRALAIGPMQIKITPYAPARPL
jgi:Maltose operon periplasmic protein precursor (MalM)